MSYQYKRNHPGYGRTGRRLAYLDDMNPDQITEEFVGDMAAGFETQVNRYIDGIRQIQKATGQTAEDIHVGITTEARKRGAAVLPGTSGLPA